MNVIEGISTFAVIDTAHPPLRDVRGVCQSCLDLAEPAVTHAVVTGSVGANFSNGEHSATVRRIFATVTL